VVIVLSLKVSIIVITWHIISIAHTGYEPACGVWYSGNMANLKYWKEWEIKEIGASDKIFPERLREVKPKVQKLYYRGEWTKSLFANCLAVVGSRRMTSYGEGSVEKILPGVVQAGVTIVSGFMYGVDTKAHQTCLDYGGKTIAVLGSGLDQLTPVSNDKLYSEVLESGGLVISEYEKDDKAMLWTFPHRNRIVAGLSQATLVIEGGENSGTLITAKLTLKQGKKVLAVPGPVSSIQAQATNGLIKEGASLVTSSEDVLRELRMNESSELARGVRNSKTLRVSGLEGQIIQELKREALDMNELGRKLKIKVSDLATKLSELQLKGVVVERLGKYSLS
jgi:DNA processing protein